MRRRAALVAVHVLLEDAQVARELTLGAVTAHFLEAFRQRALETFDNGRRHCLESFRVRF